MRCCVTDSRRSSTWRLASLWCVLSETFSIQDALTSLSYRAVDAISTAERDVGRKSQTKSICAERRQSPALMSVCVSVCVCVCVPTFVSVAFTSGVPRYSSVRPRLCAPGVEQDAIWPSRNFRATSHQGFQEDRSLVVSVGR